MARLTAAARRALPDSAFADPEHRSYPMEDAGHVKAARSLVARYGSARQKAEVSAKAAKRGPGSSPGKPDGLRKVWA